MRGFISLLLVIAFFYLAYRLFLWLPQALSSTVPCPNCDGKGHWYGIRHREDCKECQGTGKVPKTPDP